MRILHVTNELPPRSASANAHYIWELAQKQSERHWPSIFTRAADPTLPEGFSWVERRGNVTIRHMNRLALQWEPLERSYIHHAVEQQFREFLGETRADVVHFHSLEYLGLGLIDIAQSLKIKTVLTAHDFWPVCAIGTRRCRTDDQPCETIELSKCGPCVLGGEWTQLVEDHQAELEKLRPRNQSFSELYRRHYGERFAVTGGLPARRPRAVIHAMKNALRDTRWKAQEQLEASFGNPVERRLEHFGARLKHIDLVLAPSEFARGEYQRAFGLPSEKVVLDELALPGAERPAPPRVESASVRVGCLATLSRSGGVHVLVEAFLAAAATAPALELHLHGATAEGSEEFVEALRERVAASACASRVQFHGAPDPARLAELLAALDLVVFPSIGVGNAPAELLHVAHAGVGVLVSNSGGLAEFVEVHGYGRTFAQSSVEALRAELGALGADRSKLRELAGERPQFKTVQFEANELALIYHELLYGKFKAPTAAEQAARRRGEYELA